MEKRVILAVVLSFGILYLWAGLTPRPVEQKKIFQEPQISEIKQDMALKTSKSVDEEGYKPILFSPAPTPTPPPSSVAEEFVEAESEKLRVKFSNKGGTISSIMIKGYDAYFPVTNITNIAEYKDRIFSLDKNEKSIVSYVFEGDNIKIRKTYKMSKNDYIVQSEILIENKSIESSQQVPAILAYDISEISLDKNSERDIVRDKSLHEYVINTSGELHRKNNAYKFSEKENKSFENAVTWVAFRDRYYALIVKPQYETRGAATSRVSESALDVIIYPKKTTLSVGEKVGFSSIIYAGPEDINTLKAYELGFEKIKMFYRLKFLDGISKIIHSFLHFMYKGIPNWGICIILISTIIYFSMYPLTARGMASMKKMQALQPKIASLKEKYSKNPEKMNKEMMQLYKEHRINPLGGCLPFLLQMPIFIGLYQVLWRDVSFKGAHFLWIKDLSEPDALFTLPINIPFFGDKFNILPIIMMVIMFAQQKITAKNMNVTDPAQIAQQKMMQRIMPVFLGVIFYNFASGLTLYFTMFYLFSTFTQWKMSKEPKTT